MLDRLPWHRPYPVRSRWRRSVLVAPRPSIVSAWQTRRNGVRDAKAGIRVPTSETISLVLTVWPPRASTVDGAITSRRTSGQSAFRRSAADIVLSAAATKSKLVHASTISSQPDDCLTPTCSRARGAITLEQIVDTSMTTTSDTTQNITKTSKRYALSATPASASRAARLCRSHQSHGEGLIIRPPS